MYSKLELNIPDTSGKRHSFYTSFQRQTIPGTQANMPCSCGITYIQQMGVIDCGKHNRMGQTSQKSWMFLHGRSREYGQEQAGYLSSEVPCLLLSVSYYFSV